MIREVLSHESKLSLPELNSGRASFRGDAYTVRTWTRHLRTITRKCFYFPFPTEPPAFEKELADVTIKEGEEISLDVVVRGELDCELEWFKNAVDVLEGERHSFVDHGDGKHSLVIRNVEDDDTGEYCCVAQNKAGRVTCAGYMTVQGGSLDVIVCYVITHLQNLHKMSFGFFGSLQYSVVLTR